MSDDFSWAPFGSAFTEEEEGTAAPLPQIELPLLETAPEAEVELLPFEEPEPEPVVHPWAAAPVASAPPPVVGEQRRRTPRRRGSEGVIALIYGIVGLTIFPLLIPSVAAVKVGMRAKRDSKGGRDDAYANWGITLGWIGISIWGLVILVALN